MKPKLLFITVLIVFFSANVLSAADDLKQVTGTDINENAAELEKAVEPVILNRAVTTTTTSTTTTMDDLTATTTTTTLKDILATPEAEMSKSDVLEVEEEPEEPKPIMKWFSRSNTLTIVGQPLAYPNPMQGKGTTFQYSLSKDANIEIYVISQTAEILQRINCVSGQPGGSRGKNNKYWDGQTNRGRPAANGILWVNIVSKDDGKAIGKIRLTVFN